MGEVADKLADYVVVTSDNPRQEDPSEIIKDIEKGITSDSSKETIQRIGLEKRKSPFPHLINLLP